MKDLARTLRAQIPDAVTLRTAPVSEVAADGRSVRVILDGTYVWVPRLTSWTPYVSDVVLLAGSQGFWYAVGLMSAQRSSNGTAPTPPPVPAPIPATGRTAFQAIDSGTILGGSWRTDTLAVIQGDRGEGANSGAWFYGDAVRSTLGGLTVTSAALYVPRITGGSPGPQTAVIARHDLDAKSGTPSWSAQVATTVLPTDANNWVLLPAVAVQPLLAGPGGFGLNGGADYLVAAAVASDRQSGTLMIDWKR